MQAESSNTAEVNPCPPRVVRCERVLRKRTKSVLLVLDRITDPHNEAAAHRCAEALGVQHVWTVAPPLQPVKKRPKRDTKSVAKGADGWLSLQRFDNVASCVSALRVEGWDIWCAADGEGAVALGSERPPELTPAKVAVVIGREADGCDAAFLAAATHRVYFPLRGFTSSLNLSVATALVLSRVFDWYPHFVGDLDDSELRDLREEWRPRIAPTPAARAQLGGWLDAPETIPLDDADAAAAGVSCGSWAPRKIQEAERAAASGS